MAGARSSIATITSLHDERSLVVLVDAGSVQVDATELLARAARAGAASGAEAARTMALKTRMAVNRLLRRMVVIGFAMACSKCDCKKVSEGTCLRFL